MHTKDIKLIAMDMDGTLVNSRQRISPENVSALLDAQAQGIRLAICSGRLCGDIASFIESYGLGNCAILSLNGAYCLTGSVGSVISNHFIQKHALQATIEVLTRHEMLFGCFAQNRLVVSDGSKPVDADFWGTHMEGPHMPQVHNGEKAVAEVCESGVNKLLCYSPDVAALSCVRAELEGILDLTVTSSWANNLEIMPGDADKGTGIRELTAKLGLEASQVMAIGDYDNDESMIAYAGLGIAMGNASECIKRAAKLITLTNDEHGVAYAIRQYALH